MTRCRSLIHRLTHLLMVLWCAPALALIPPTSCGGPPDENGEVSDLSMEYWVQQEASSTMCAYGYWAEKCGDHATALAIFDKCIDAGFVGAMVWKALMLETGNGVEQDSVAAAELLRQAAHSDNKDYATLGKLHWATALYLGKGVERDETEAMKWFKEAAAEGDPDAQEFLATGNHTADRDLEARSVAAQLAAQGPQGQKLEPVDTPPADTAPGSPVTPLLWGLGVLMLAGIAHRVATTRRMEARA